MKKAIAVLPLALISVLLAAQSPFPSKSEISQFSSSTTCVVLVDDQFSPFNVFIKKAMKEFWTITPFEFIEQDEFEMIPFKFENGRLCFEEDINRDADILETTPVFCQRCTWHDKINTLK